MKTTKLRWGAYSLVVVFAFSVFSSPLVGAAGYVGTTYFEDVDNGNYMYIPDNQDGLNSVHGSVLPNRDMSTQDTHQGAGAIGTKALAQALKDASGVNLNDSYANRANNPAAKNQRRKDALFAFLKQKNQTGSAWEKMGSALIVHQMTGKDWGVGSRSISDSEWNDLRARLDNNDLQMERLDVSHRHNTAGVFVQRDGAGPYNVYDAVRYDYDDDMGVDAWVFTINGKRVYQLQIICANPIGSTTGLPVVEVKKYDLVPLASVDKTVVEPNDTATVTNTVKNSSGVASDQTDWRLTQMVYKPGTSLSAADKKGRDDAKDPCTSFTGAGRSSCTIAQQSNKEVFTLPSKSFSPEFTYSVPANTPVGTKICFTASVSKPTRDAAPVWRHSDLQCIIVAKKPKTQVWGGDVRAGGTINTSTNTLDGKTYGSWGEYAALSNGQNSGFGSGSGLNGGNANPAQSAWSSLTFANTSTCTFGCYNFTLSSRSLADQFGSGTTVPAGGNLNSWDNGTYTTSGLTLNSVTLSKGKSIVILSTGTVTITGDIKYNDGPYASVQDIPQLVIRAPAINIQGGVGRVDAWLVAIDSSNKGVLNTCSDVAVNAQLTASVCNKPLVINGPVVADKIYLRRTAGSDGAVDSRGNPAETFNLRADAYLWGSSYANSKGKVRTVYTKELPPRF